MTTKKKVYIPHHDEKLKIFTRMKTYGGSFESHLAEAMIRADNKNLEKLCAAFPEIIEKYKNW